MPDSLPELGAATSWASLYEPAARQPAGGDLYGAWALPGGEVALLVGDVAGKGVETAALSAMARFFIEARSWDATSPAKVLAQANVMLRSRLPSDTFVTAFLGFLAGGGLRYANAGHLPPCCCAPDGALGEAPGARPAAGHRRPRRRTRSTELALSRGDMLYGATPTGWSRRAATARCSAGALGRARRGAGAARRPLEELVELVHERVRWWAGRLTDDAVALAVRRR